MDLGHVGRVRVRDRLGVGGGQRVGGARGEGGGGGVGGVGGGGGGEGEEGEDGGLGEAHGGYVGGQRLLWEPLGGLVLPMLGVRIRVGLKGLSCCLGS